jgi:type VI secretion system VgrG family protein
MDLDDAQAVLAWRGLDDASRLYRLETAGGPGDPLAGLLPEAWTAEEALDRPWRLELWTLSRDATLAPQALLGRRLTLWTRLADGTEWPRGGLVTEAAAEGADGGLARHHLVVEPWLALLGHQRRSQVWQDRHLTEIVESLFAAYPQAHWRWAACVAPFLEQSPQAGQRAYTVQYRETDLAFLTRLLAREGLVMRLQRDDSAPLGHTLVLLADSPSLGSSPQDAVSAMAQGVRFHARGAEQAQDAVQAMTGWRRWPVALSTALAWDPEAKAAVAASVPTTARWGLGQAPALEEYDDAESPAAFTDPGQAERALRLQQQAHEARHKCWRGHSSVRSFSAGTWFDLLDSDLELPEALRPPDQAAQARRFLLTRVVHAGLNNLPRVLQRQSAHAWGPPEDALPESLRDAVRATGYANHFEASRLQVPWRPARHDAEGRPIALRAPAPGLLTATVVGPSGEDRPQGENELHLDAQGRIRIRFDFQCQPQAAAPGTSTRSPWVRVLQRWAGAGMGSQFIPRIGQEVLVDFLGGDLERPVVLGALYNGQGEAGRPPTPGGQPAAERLGALAASGDQRPGAQGNLVDGGHSPAWHGAGAADLSAGGQRNAAALSGFKSRGLGGAGHSQLVFDDSDEQLRVQLATTQHASQLNLGHLIHQADNHRGSFRGLGFELRTDAWGALRGGAGVLLSSHGQSPSEPAGDQAASLVLQAQLQALAQGFSRTAGLHQGLRLASVEGSSAAGRSALSDQAAPAMALRQVLGTTVSAGPTDTALADAAERQGHMAPDRVPQLGAPVVSVAARAGLLGSAAQDLILAADELITLAAGQDLQQVSGAGLRVHAQQAIGIVAGALQPGTEATGTGLSLIASQGDLQLRAHEGPLQLAARDDLNVQSQQGPIDLAAARRLVLVTGGGARITLEDGGITVECPGQLTVQASQKSFQAAQPFRYPVDPLTRQDFCLPCFLRAAQSGAAMVPA